ncbi:cyclin-related 2 [Wallemia mellicola CBS 633.66]|uniref:Cyclin n=2 Tax=Wallemia mellicola TaxID=1708541 RepID=I4YB82_WALMC|nr:cyclin-related 2 [Wallemia mellicola CBS 633.66]EIM21224.1 cyclin-related 2 [Wallemia mellicola CBS 633.66]|eukprot:XP_006958896.1 cyclin-related 2 [Wallemia mellicola CBS 633.66]
MDDLIEFDTNNLIDLLDKFLLDELSKETNNTATRTTPTTSACIDSLNNPSSLQLFQAKSIPTISIKNYLSRILRYCPSTNQVFLSLLVYFNRMKSLSNVFTLNSYNIHRLIIAGITVSSKFLSDIFYTNSRYAKVGGLPLSELNQLELHFLLLNDFNLFINKSEIDFYFKLLLEH